MRESLIFLILISFFVSLPLPYIIPGIGEADFIAYWSAARLLVNGQDPYSLSDITELQMSQFPERKTDEGNYLILAWNPPWLNLLFIPLGVVNFKTATHIWLFFNIFLIGLGVLLVWDLSVQPFNRKGYIYILVLNLLFIESLISLIIGQITAIILVSLVLGFWLIKKKYDFLAGIILVFSLIKPHLIYFPLLLLLIWSVRSRRWKILYGFVSIILLSGIVMWFYIPNWLAEYIHLLGNLPNYQETTGTIGNFFGTIFSIDIFHYAFLLVLPLIIPFTKKLEDSLDLAPINAATLISLFLAPYGFGVDHILIIPSVVQFYSWIRKKHFSILLNMKYLIAYISINALIIVFLLLRLPSYWGFWFPLLYLILFIYGWYRYRKSSSHRTFEVE
jgi:hypothetical protein